jgi:abhydrolase domain-containing protein 4
VIFKNYKRFYKFRDYLEQRFANDETEPAEKYESMIFDSLSKKFDRYYVYIKNADLKIWTASTNIQSKNTPIVLIHGLCGSIGLWAFNMDKLPDNHPIYAFDVLGFGRSSRPSFSRDPMVAEDELIDSIEEWRKKLGLESMILIGHSFGGFLFTAYALKYPHSIKALVLVGKCTLLNLPALNKKIHFLQFL